MKLHVLFDKDGEILAAVDLGGDGSVRARPVPDEGQGHRTADVFVPRDYQHYDLAAIAQRLKVDARAKLPELKAKTASKS